MVHIILCIIIISYKRSLRSIIRAEGTECDTPLSWNNHQWQNSAEHDQYYLKFLIPPLHRHRYHQSASFSCTWSDSHSPQCAHSYWDCCPSVWLLWLWILHRGMATSGDHHILQSWNGCLWIQTPLEHSCDHSGRQRDTSCIRQRVCKMVDLASGYF